MSRYVLNQWSKMIQTWTRFAYRKNITFFETPHGSQNRLIHVYPQSPRGPEGLKPLQRITTMKPTKHSSPPGVRLERTSPSGWWARATPLKNMSSSFGMISNPIYGNIKNGNQTTNQPFVWAKTRDPVDWSFWGMGCVMAFGDRILWG